MANETTYWARTLTPYVNALGLNLALRSMEDKTYWVVKSHDKAKTLILAEGDKVYCFLRGYAKGKVSNQK